MSRLRDFKDILNVNARSPRQMAGGAIYHHNLQPGSPGSARHLAVEPDFISVPRVASYDLYCFLLANSQQRNEWAGPTHPKLPNIQMIPICFIDTFPPLVLLKSLWDCRMGWE